MKLNDRASTAAETVHTQEIRKLRSTTTARTAISSADAPPDRVEFSDNLDRLALTLSAYDTSRANRVQVLAAQYLSGQYRPDPLATSQAMVSTDLVAGPRSDRGRDG